MPKTRNSEETDDEESSTRNQVQFPDGLAQYVDHSPRNRDPALEN